MAYVDGYRDIMLDHSLGGDTDTPEATWYIGLSTTTPTDAGGNVTEPAVGAYARVAVTNNLTNFPAATDGVKKNGTVITFPESTASWGTVTHFVIYDAATSGNIRFWGPLDSSVAVGDNFTLSFAVDGITFTRATGA